MRPLLSSSGDVPQDAPFHPVKVNGDVSARARARKHRGLGNSFLWSSDRTAAAADRRRCTDARVDERSCGVNRASCTLAVNYRRPFSPRFHSVNPSNRSLVPLASVVIFVSFARFFAFIVAISVPGRSQPFNERTMRLSYRGRGMNSAWNHRAAREEEEEEEA